LSGIVIAREATPARKPITSSSIIDGLCGFALEDFFEPRRRRLVDRTRRKE
jgi:hypothetical protein